MAQVEVSLGQVMERAREDQPFFEQLLDDIDTALKKEGWTLSVTDREHLDWMVSGALGQLSKGLGSPVKPW